MANEITLPTPPEGYEYVIQKKPKTKDEQIQELEAEKIKVKKPSDDELIEIGKKYHLYYLLQDNIDMLKIE